MSHYTYKNPDSRAKPEFDEICLACGHRFGEHYGSGDDSFCSKQTAKELYTGTFFIKSGLYSNEKGKCHLGSIKGKNIDPNLVFKSMK